MRGARGAYGRGQSRIRRIRFRRVAIGEPDALPVRGNGGGVCRGQRRVGGNHEDLIGRIGLVRLGGEVERLEIVSQPAGATGAVLRDQSAPGAALIVLDSAGPPDVHPVRLDVGELRLRQQRLERVDRAVVGIDADQKFVLGGGQANGRLCHDVPLIVRKRVSIRTGKSRNGELSSAGRHSAAVSETCQNPRLPEPRVRASLTARLAVA